MRTETIKCGWEFGKFPDQNIRELREDSLPCFDEKTKEFIDLPHTWYRDGAGYKGLAGYRKTIFPDYSKTERVFLCFGAAERWCKVFVNGKYVGEHKGGYSAFSFEITAYCRRNEENELFVFVDNRSWDEISPLTGDFTVFGGLYRDVKLVVTGDVCFDRTYYGTAGALVRAGLTADGTGTVAVEPHILGMRSEQAVLYCQIFDQNKECVTEWRGNGKDRPVIELKDPKLWEGKKQPALYYLHIRIEAADRVTDRLEIPFGFRSLALDAEKGFFLNKTHMKINGVAKHQDTAEVFHAAGPQHWQQDLNDVLEIGANSIRLSHYQHPQEMYDLCDEAGLVVWAEIPMLKLTGKKELFENACSQLKELILQNLHHPSICFWGIQNEIAMFGENEQMYEQIRELEALAKALDPTRISGSANLFCVENKSPLNRITDAVGYNIYFGWYYGEIKDNAEFVDRFHQDNPDISLGITEYGVDANTAFHSDEPKVKDYSEEYQALYHEKTYPIFKEREYIWGTYVWNLYDFSSEIRDEGGVKYKNCKGLISYDRKLKKDAFYYYKSQWAEEPFVKIAESRFEKRACEAITVKVYSNQREVTLLADQNSFTQQSDTGVFQFKGIKLRPGKNFIRAVSGENSDEAVFERVEQPEQSYIFVDPNPGLNVKNWFTDEVEEEKMFPKGKFSIRDSCVMLLNSDDAMTVIEGFSLELANQMRERQSPMPLERILSYMKNQISESQCKELNEMLIKVEKNS